MRKLGTIKALNLAITGGQIPGKPSPIVSIQQAFGFSGGCSQSSLGGRTVSNPVQDTGYLQEAVERARAYLRGKATHQTEQEGEEETNVLRRP